MFEIAILCLCVTALLAYVNHRWVGLPSTIGVMLIAMMLSIGIVGVHKLGFYGISGPAFAFIQSIDFSEALMDGMLSMLLFAGALHVDSSQLRKHKWQVLGLSVFGTMLSTIIIGAATYLLTQLFAVPVSFWLCMVFGALISPTDPIAVMGILKQNRAPESLGIVISCESLFNDGVGVVLFTLLLNIALKGSAPDGLSIATLVLHEVGGGLLLGLVLGGLLYYMLRTIDNYGVEVMLTLAGVLGGYLLASKLHVSGPLAMVITGLLIGNHAREKAMSAITRQHVDLFWALIDEMLNAVLFVLLGFEIILISLSWNLQGLCLSVILLTIFARWLTVGLPFSIMEKIWNLPKNAWKVLTWGGLRGGISVALVLSLPSGAPREVLLTMTYAVVMFSMLVQGLTIGRVIGSSVDVQDQDQKK